MKMKKKLKTFSIKTRKTLVEYKTVSNNNLLLTPNWYLPVFTEAAPQVDRNKIKSWQSSKIHRYFLKTSIFKDIRDVR